MDVQGMKVLPTGRQLETISNGATMSTNTNNRFRPSLTDALPVEMIQAVCEYLHQEDLVNFRLANNICAGAGMDSLVQDIYVIFTRESFEKLLNISNHPEISKRVMAIHYDPFKFIPVSEDQYGDMSAPITFPDTLEESNPSPEYLIDLARGFEAHKKICEEQALMTKSKFSTRVFSQVLPKFSSLKKFIMADCDFEQSDRLKSDSSPMPTHRGCGNYYEERREEALMFLAAAATAGTKLEYLDLDVVDFDMLLGASISTNIFPDGSDARYLRYLSVRGMNSTSQNFNRGLRQLLRATSNLEHLSIDKRFYAVGSLEMDWDVVLVGLKLPYLKSVQLSNIGGKPSSLTEFLVRHARTLRSLKLTNCHLEGSVADWADIFDKIMNHLTLERVSFAWLAGLVRTGFESIDRQVKLNHKYHSLIFQVLLEDRLTHKNLLAKKCSLTPSVLWRDYLSYVKAQTHKATARFAELSSQGLEWSDRDDDESHLMDFI
ncbi:hypothetical protein EAF00_009759 [Botryotinia globosa]|nr:hypothetical protein EAF00_009759 [Botryotinia globosa]